MTTYVALLRGINVGGNTLVSMADLKICFERMGYKNVKTYINSGNVIFSSDEKDSRKLETVIEKSLDKTFSYSIVVVVKSFDEIKDIVNHAPKNWPDENQRCDVLFLRHTIDDSKILEQMYPKPDIDEVHYHSGVVFWSANKSQLTKSNVSKLVGKPIYKEMTIRIFNTVQKIYTLMQEV